MEFKREKSYNFSMCLFAYVYKDAHSRLPIEVDYSIPDNNMFTHEIAKCVLYITEKFGKLLRPVLSKIFPEIRSPYIKCFAFVKWYTEYILNLSSEYLTEWCENPNFPELFWKFLTMCSFITELVYFSFERNCYSLVSSAPDCLAELILNLPENFADSGFFDHLIEFCSEVVKNQNFDLFDKNYSSLEKQVKDLENCYSDSIFTMVGYASVFDDSSLYLDDKGLDAMLMSNASITDLVVPPDTMSDVYELLRKSKRKSVSSQLDFQVSNFKCQRKRNVDSEIKESFSNHSCKRKSDGKDYEETFSKSFLEQVDQLHMNYEETFSKSFLEKVDKLQMNYEETFSKSFVEQVDQFQMNYKDNYDIEVESSTPEYAIVEEFQPTSSVLSYFRPKLSVCELCKENCVDILEVFIDDFKEIAFEFP